MPKHSSISDADWKEIYKKAWSDTAFRDLLETDPTKALNSWAADNGKSFDKLVSVQAQPAQASSGDDDGGVPSCC